MNTETAVLAGLALGAVAAYAWKWRKNYVQVMRERRVRDMVPMDVVGGYIIPLEDIAEFDSIVEFTCMLPCCYEPEGDGAEIWLDPDED